MNWTPDLLLANPAGLFSQAGEQEVFRQASYRKSFSHMDKPRQNQQIYIYYFPCQDAEGTEKRNVPFGRGKICPPPLK